MDYRLHICYKCILISFWILQYVSVVRHDVCFIIPTRLVMCHIEIQNNLLIPLAPTISISLKISELMAKIFHIDYLVMHNLLMHACAKSKLLYGVYICTGDNPFAKAR